jgi:hypothetical protein
MRGYSYDALSSAEKAAFAYYVRLLSIRTSGFEAAAALFEHREGRSPEDGDAAAVDALAHQLLGARGYVLAKKSAGKPRLGLADEVVVYAAVSTAIATGRRTLILTKDEDLQEHFYKLLWLLDAQ